MVIQTLVSGGCGVKGWCQAVLSLYSSSQLKLQRCLGDFTVLHKPNLKPAQGNEHQQ